MLKGYKPHLIAAGFLVQLPSPPILIPGEVGDGSDFLVQRFKKQKLFYALIIKTESQVDAKINKRPT